MARLYVKAVPKSSRNDLGGWIGDALKVRVMAAPERGKANRAVAEVIAHALSIADSRVTIVSGEASERKVVEIEGFSDDELREQLDRCLCEKLREPSG